METTAPEADARPMTFEGQTRTVAEWIESLGQVTPDDEAIEAAAATLWPASPAMIEGHARWLTLLPALERALATHEVLQVCARAIRGIYGGKRSAPAPALVDQVLRRGGEGARAWASALCDAALAGDAGVRPLAASAAAHLLGARDPDELVGLIDFYASGHARRALLTAASPAARTSWLRTFLAVSELSTHADGARFIGARIERVLPCLDLFDAPDARACLEEALQAAGEEPAAAMARRVIADGEPLPDPLSLNRQSARTVREQQAAKRRAAQLAPLLQGVAGRAVEVDDADELRELAAWIDATDERRTAIAGRVAKAADMRFESLTAFAQWPVATFQHDGEAYLLIPGGTVEVGLSDDEERVVRAAARRAEEAGSENLFEEYGSLLESVGDLRPVHPVRVPPFLVAQRAIEVLKHAEIVEIVEASGLRVLTNAEFEYLLRGGVARGLTPMGDAIPTGDTLAALEDPIAPFGAAGLGVLPELCSDSYARGYGGSPADGSPRLGPAPLVVRGGAGWVYPWQECGEWQLLCNAVRSHSDGWDGRAATRLALGVVPRTG